MDGAYVATLLILAAGVVLSLLRGLHVEQATVLSRDRFGADHWRTGEAIFATGVSLVASGQSARGEPLLRRAAAVISPHRRAQPRLAERVDAALSQAQRMARAAARVP